MTSTTNILTSIINALGGYVGTIIFIIILLTNLIIVYGLIGSVYFVISLSIGIMDEVSKKNDNTTRISFGGFLVVLGGFISFMINLSIFMASPIIGIGVKTPLSFLYNSASNLYYINNIKIDTPSLFQIIPFLTYAYGVYLIARCFFVLTAGLADNITIISKNIVAEGDKKSSLSALMLLTGLGFIIIYIITPFLGHTGLLNSSLYNLVLINN